MSCTLLRTDCEADFGTLCVSSCTFGREGGGGGGEERGGCASGPTRDKVYLAHSRLTMNSFWAGQCHLPGYVRGGVNIFFLVSRAFPAFSTCNTPGIQANHILRGTL